MTTKKSFIDALRLAAKRMEPFVSSPVMAPFAVVLIGLALHGSFTFTSGNRVVFGGPNDEGGEVIGVAQAAEVTAINQMPIATDELDSEPELTGIYDSVSVAEIGPFGTAYSSGGAFTHRVKPTETLYSIAQEYGIPQKSLVNANRALSEPLIVGDEIIIPASVTPASFGGADSRHLSTSYLPEGFRWPASGKIGPAHGRFEARDIPNVLGTTIVAAGSGTVIGADYGWDGGYGNRIIIDHGNGLHTLYGHLNDLVVTVGQTVKEGEVIGFMGSTGRSTGPHVHFEVRWNQ